ncbi:MAG TPA: glucose-6-phosphate dehydrogenase [Rhizomicrobium sp.]|nr:glucose-6-phosphate dehydrogenase [Rhizomicrobium sp.]
MSARAKPAPSCVMVLFGANGDLTKRLIVPALYNLAKAGLLPERFALIGIDHGDRTTEAWRKGLHDFLEESFKNREGEFETKNIEENIWQRVSGCFTYMKAEFDDPDTYKRLGPKLEALDREEELGGNVLFYLAVADRFFGPVVTHLGQAGLTKEEGQGWRRVVVEKPFGHDLESALALNARLLKCLDESQIYRIDHFLGKETVQNIMAFRFANGLFEPVWHRDRIDHVQVTVAESIGIEERGKFYEQTGALRDMVPNHLFQLVAMTAMEPPVSFDAEAVRAKKAEVFQAVQPVRPEDVVRGQYGAGRVAGLDVKGYREENFVAADSPTETYVALKLRIDNWRWAGVPFYLRTGKRMPRRSTEIAIRFKQAPFALFRDTEVDQMAADWLILKIQPDEGIRLRFNAKRPGPGVALEGVAMDFKYKDWFKQTPNVGYETLLYDCFIGDATLFQRADQVEAAWAAVQPVLNAWSAAPPKRFPNYAAGAEGPSAADELIARDGRTWRPVH